MAVRILRRAFDVDEYHRMAKAGILSEDDRVELLEGEIVEMSPIGSRHQGCVDRLARLLFEFAERNYIVRVQGPVRLNERSEPDLALLKPRPDFYSERHPTPEDELLLIEVSETSADYDREVKLPLYAGAGIAEVWIADLEAQTIEAHAGPGRNAYETVTTARRGETVASPSVPELFVRADDILG
jgi:Uma2 family endonuclease